MGSNVGSVRWLMVLLLTTGAQADSAKPPLRDPAAGCDWADCAAVSGRVLSFRIEPEPEAGGAPESAALIVYELRGETWRRLHADDGRGYRPWKVRLCELDGDSLPEVALGVFKTARLDPVERRRLFIFDWTPEDELVPLWLGSRLSYELDDFAFVPGGDGTDLLLAAEHQDPSGCVVRSYRWRGFGFLADGDRWRADESAGQASIRQACACRLSALAASSLQEAPAGTRGWRHLRDWRGHPAGN